jgi:methyltransferase-like protein
MLNDTDASASYLGKSNKSQNLMLLLRARDAEFKNRYGGSPEKWKAMSTTSLLAADLADAVTENANRSMQLTQLQTQRQELESRGNTILGQIARQGQKVAAEQTGAFTKAGVKLEGSAMNVVRQTMEEADTMAAQKQREMNYRSSQMKIQEQMIKAKMAQAPMETLLGMGQTYALSQMG